MLIQEWGNATWFLFHTLAYKLKDQESEHAPVLLNIFIGICNNLPCPDCRQDASNMLKTANTNLVKTKYDLIRFMWQFHNFVNRKLDKKETTIEEHDVKYEKAITHQIVNNYVRQMSKNANNRYAMLDAFRRKENTEYVTTYYAMNKNLFNP